MTFSVLCWCCSAGAKQFPEDPCHCEDFGAECCYQSPHPGSKRSRRPAFPAVEGCRPEGRSSKNGVEKLVTRVKKKFERRKRMNTTTCCEDISLRLRRRKGESASAWATRSYECYQRSRQALARVQGVTEPEVTKKKSGAGESWRRQATQSEPQANLNEGDTPPEARPRAH